MKDHYCSFQANFNIQQYLRANCDCHLLGIILSHTQCSPNLLASVTSEELVKALNIPHALRLFLWDASVREFKQVLAFLLFWNLQYAHALYRQVIAQTLALWRPSPSPKTNSGPSAHESLTRHRRSLARLATKTKMCFTPDVPGSPDTLDLTHIPPPLDLTPTALPAAATTISTGKARPSHAPPETRLSLQNRIQSTVKHKSNSGQRRRYHNEFPPWNCAPYGVVCVDRIIKKVHTKGNKYRSRVNYSAQLCRSGKFINYHPSYGQHHINSPRHKRWISLM